MSTRKITPLEKFDHFVNRPIFSLVVILVVTLLTYIWILPNEFVMDDFAFIVDWPLIRDWHNIVQFFVGYTPPPGQEGIYSPLKTLIHAINYHLFGTHVLGHHLFSIVVHGCGVMIVYWLSLLLTTNRRVSFLTAFLFALHPVHAEPIISMIGSVDVVGVLFLFLSFGFFVNARRDGVRRRNYFAAVLATAVAVYTHELCISLPVLLVWYDLCYLKKKDLVGLLRWHWPFCLIVISYVEAKWIVLGSLTRGHYIYDNPIYTFWIIIKALAKYIYISFAPITLTHNQVISSGISSFDPDDFNRFAVISQNILQPQILISVVLLSCVALWTIALWNINRLLSFCVGWFFICLLPVCNIVPSGVFFAERYLYPGSFAFCLMLGLWFDQWCGWRKNQFPNNGFAWAMMLFITLITFYMLRIMVRIPEWRNEMSLYESAVMANDQSALMKTDLGIVCLKNGQFDKAVFILKEAIKIRPEDPVTYFVLAEALTRLNKIDEAMASLNGAIQLKPDYVEAYYNLAGLYASQGKPDLAQVNLERAMFLLKAHGQEKEAKELEESFYKFWTDNGKN